jgi:hypothetical protein
MTPKNYSIEFVERTKQVLEILEQKAKENNLEVTFLLNTLLGLIVMCSEKGKNIFNKKIDDDFIEKIIPQDIQITENITIEFKQGMDDKIERNITKKEFLISKEQIWFIEKIRNGIAHQNIEPNPNGGEIWTHIRIYNKRNNKIDFGVTLSIDQLKKLALSIADTYLEKNRKTA